MSKVEIKEINIGIDVNGADNSPYAFIEGAVYYLNNLDVNNIFLFGKKNEIEKELKKLSYDKSRLTIVDSLEIIESNDHPALSIKTKKDASMVKGLHYLNDGKIDAFLSAGNSGALFLGSNHYIKTINNIKRPIFAAFVPTLNSPALLLDCGANLEPSSSDLIYYAIIGDKYYKLINKNKSPKIALLNIGEEDEKGTNTLISANNMLKEVSSINYIGNLEARELPFGKADIVVTDAFTGNIALKVYEGSAKAFLEIVKNTLNKNLKTKIGALLIKNDLKKSFKNMKSSNFSGAPLLGLNKLVIKMHGNSTKNQVYNSIIQAGKLVELDLIESLKGAIDNKIG